MQKKLIALAVAGLASTAAFAQSNVTIYGVVDAGYSASSGDRGPGARSANRNGIQSGILSGSRIGFRGEEGLGNGLKAVFTLEYAIDVDANNGIGTNGAAGLNARQQFIGLSSATLGTVALGRQYAPAFYASGRNDPFMSSTGIGSLARMTFNGGNTISGTGTADNNVTNGGSRWDNAVTYTSPVWSGFSVRAAYSFAENNGGGAGISSGDNGKFGLGANYANGGLNLDVVFHHIADAQRAAVPGDDNVTEWYVGGSYDFKVVKLFASYQTLDDKSGTSATELSNKIWQVGATVPVFGNGKIHAGYTRLSWDQSGAGDNKAWNLMYSHALSKRTVLYTGYTRFDNDRTALRAFTNAQQPAGVAFAGEKNGTFAAGINHSF